MSNARLSEVSRVKPLLTSPMNADDSEDISTFLFPVISKASMILTAQSEIDMGESPGQGRGGSDVFRTVPLRNI